MSDLDFRRTAEQEVEKLHIFDQEWKDELVNQYADYLRSMHEKPLFRPYLLVTNEKGAH
jgi:hypothetical protein